MNFKTNKNQILVELAKFSRQCDECARCLRREVESGKCIRQSPESKMARVDILECHSEWAYRMIEKYA